jgi:hypothetical protein
MTTGWGCMTAGGAAMTGRGDGATTGVAMRAGTGTRRTGTVGGGATVVGTGIVVGGAVVVTGGGGCPWDDGAAATAGRPVERR